MDDANRNKHEVLFDYNYDIDLPEVHYPEHMYGHDEKLAYHLKLMKKASASLKDKELQMEQKKICDLRGHLMSAMLVRDEGIPTGMQAASAPQSIMEVRHYINKYDKMPAEFNKHSDKKNTLRYYVQHPFPPKKAMKEHKVDFHLILTKLQRFMTQHVKGVRQFRGTDARVTSLNNQVHHELYFVIDVLHDILENSKIVPNMFTGSSLQVVSTHSENFLFRASGLVLNSQYAATVRIWKTANMIQPTGDKDQDCFLLPETLHQMNEMLLQNDSFTVGLIVDRISHTGQTHETVSDHVFEFHPVYDDFYQTSVVLQRGNHALPQKKEFFLRCRTDEERTHDLPQFAFPERLLMKYLASVFRENSTHVIPALDYNRQHRLDPSESWQQYWENQDYLVEYYSKFNFAFMSFRYKPLNMQIRMLVRYTLVGRRKMQDDSEDASIQRYVQSVRPYDEKNNFVPYFYVCRIRPDKDLRITIRNPERNKEYWAQIYKDLREIFIKIESNVTNKSRGSLQLPPYVELRPYIAAVALYDDGSLMRAYLRRVHEAALLWAQRWYEELNKEFFKKVLIIQEVPAKQPAVDLIYWYRDFVFMDAYKLPLDLLKTLHPMIRRELVACKIVYDIIPETHRKDLYYCNKRIMHMVYNLVTRNPYISPAYFMFMVHQTKGIDIMDLPANYFTNLECTEHDLRVFAKETWTYAHWINFTNFIPEETVVISNPRTKLYSHKTVKISDNVHHATYQQDIRTPSKNLIHIMNPHAQAASSTVPLWGNAKSFQRVEDLQVADENLRFLLS